jgi:hypothetical protein
LRYRPITQSPNKGQRESPGECEQMQPLSALELLETWEQGWGLAPVHRALALLAAAFPEESYEALAQRPIGRRNALLLRVREWLFGRQVVGAAFCPACGEQLELNFTTTELCPPPGDEDPPDTLLLQHEEYGVHFRLPNSLDLDAIPAGSDPAAIRQLLLRRCLVAAQKAGKATAADQLPATVLDELVARMEEVDPQANIQLALACPNCGHEWQASFDILAYLWRELEDWAVRTLGDVHRLAATYGWRESDILNMTPWRRQIYLDLIEQ